MTATVGVEDRSITLNDLRFHYRAWGVATMPPLVLLHGGWENARTWDRLASVLAGRYRVLVPDQRGHGESDRAADYATARMVEDLEAFVDALCPGRVSLFGYSMGAIVATMYTGARPGAVERLVIVDHGPDVVGRLRPKLEARGTVHRPPPEVDPVLTLPEPVLSTIPSSATQWAAIARIACPTLLVRAEHSDRFGRETAERMARVIPECRLVEIPQSGHGILRQNPDALIAAVRQFLMPDETRPGAN